MYAETGMMFPYFQGILPEFYHSQQVELLRRLQIDRSSLHDSDLVIIDNVLQSSTVTEYDLGGEGDLFKAPEPIIEEPPMDFDLVAAAISMMSTGDGAIPAEEEISRATIDPIGDDCQPLKSQQDAKISSIEGDRDKVAGEGPMQRSVSSGCLTSEDWRRNGGGRITRPNFLDFQGMDLQAVFGMRRAHSEGDIQPWGERYDAQTPPSLSPSSHFDRIEERRQKLSRYRKKKTRRNFGRKIEYACRKALADSQPRVREGLRGQRSQRWEASQVVELLFVCCLLQSQAHRQGAGLRTCSQSSSVF
ncbi:unnamed protein product [Spirodela intermedia]|uniref:CCT domain-containing protein n=1 Tax=Spirodela intermedia TaxID=51605 RepID=A0A7I8JP10_SPIIN|nr:unnamed protein product [Spirodela intermedia]CAA6671501.1 unnamed protein product [Spirodela intermedia]